MGRRRGSAEGSHKQRNVLNAVPRRVRREVETELLGIWAQPTKQGALTQLAAFQAKYGQLYPEAVRSLAEEEDKTLTFYDFPQTMHRSIRTTNAIESLGSQWSSTHRSDGRVHHRDEVPHDRLGHHRGHSTSKSPGRIDWVAAKEGAA